MPPGEGGPPPGAVGKGVLGGPPVKELLRLTATPVPKLPPELPPAAVAFTPVLVERDALEATALLLLNCDAEGEGESDGEVVEVIGANELDPPLPLPALPCVLIIGEPDDKVEFMVEVPEKPSRFSTGNFVMGDVLGTGALKSGGNREDMIFIIQSSKDMGR